MARKRISLSAELEAEIVSRAARGESAETIFYAIGKVVSARTIRRRIHELRPHPVCPTCGRSR